MSDKTRFARLQASLAQVDAHLHIIDTSTGEETGQIIRLISESGATRVAVTNEELITALDLTDSLREAGIEVLEPPSHEATPGEVDVWKKQLSETHTGLTSALGIAEETGSMLLTPLRPDQRMVSLLPVHHIAVLRAEQVVPNISKLMELWTSKGDTRGSAVFVTGPSRTADIEKELVLGVHGPQAVDVVILA